MRKRIAIALTALTMLAGSSVAIAAPHDPRDDNPNNDHGQCTAFFNGQKKGHPVWSAEDVQAFYDACTAEGGGGIGGNPGKNGRYPSCFDDGDCDN